MNLEQPFPTTAGAYQTTSSNPLNWEIIVFRLDPRESGASALLYASHLGGTFGEELRDFTIDATGRAIVVGETDSTNFPVSNGGYQSDPGDNNYDGFVAVIDPSASGASSLAYSSYLGGGGLDRVTGTAVDTNGQICVVGTTQSTNFPVTSGAFKGTRSGAEDAFVTRIDPGSIGVASFTYSSYLGFGAATDVDVNDSGWLYVCGVTSTTSFPVSSGACQATYGGGTRDVFLTVIDSVESGASSFLYSTYLGGTGIDSSMTTFQSDGKSIKVLEDNSALLIGTTRSSDFPTTSNAFQTGFGGGVHDVFVARIDPSISGSNSLVLSTFIGGNDIENPLPFELDDSGMMCLGGNTQSSNFPVTGTAFQGTRNGLLDTFVVRFDPNASGAGQLLYSSYIGGSGVDAIRAIVAGSNGVVFALGTTPSSDFPITGNAYQSVRSGSSDSYLVGFDTGKNGSASLIYGTYLGGSTSSDTAIGGQYDSLGNLHLVGFTGSGDFPVRPGGYQAAYAGGQDLFVAVFKFGPAAPNDLTATPSNSIRAINLAWTDNATDNTGYTVQRRRPGYNWGNTTTLGDVTSWQDTVGLNAGFTYEYRVRAFNTLGASDWVTAQATMPASPNTPSGLNASADGSSRINLAWTDNSTDEDGFRLERRSGGGSFTTVAKLGANVTSCVNAGLAASTSYTYRVRSYRGIDLSAPSGEASATTGSSLAAPSGLQGSASGSSRIQLFWLDNSSDETGFKLERKGTGGSFTGIASVGAGVTSYTVAGLAAGTAYTFRVRAVRGVELSAPSNEAGATTAAAVVAPSDLTVTPNGSRRLDLAWTDNASDETSYKIERKSGSGNFAVIATVPAGAVSYANTGLIGGVQYTYRVRAYRGSDFSAYSGSAMATANP